MACNYTYTFHNRKNKKNKEKRWFELWVVEGYSVRQLVNISRRGIWKIKGVVSAWLRQAPAATAADYPAVKYLLFDGTYFKHENCLMVAMDNAIGKVVAHSYCLRENYINACAVFNELKYSGVSPKSITIDGNISVIRALKAVWPDILIQRCLTHIQRQGLSWLRRRPQLMAGQDLRSILLTVTDIKTKKEKIKFINEFNQWERKYGNEVCGLPSSHKVYGDLQRTRSLILHATADMFHYLNDSNIPATTNRIEGYFSRLKIIYRQHRGLSKKHRQNFFNWYIHFKNPA